METVITTFIDYSHLMGDADSSESYVHQTVPHRLAQNLSTFSVILFNGEHTMVEFNDLGREILLKARPVRENKTKEQRIFSWKFETSSSNKNYFGRSFKSQFEIFIPKPLKDEIAASMLMKETCCPLVRVKFQNNKRWMMETYTLEQFLSIPFSKMMPDEKREELIQAASTVQVWNGEDWIKKDE